LNGPRERPGVLYRVLVYDVIWKNIDSSIMNCGNIPNGRIM